MGAGRGCLLTSTPYGVIHTSIRTLPPVSDECVSLCVWGLGNVALRGYPRCGRVTQLGEVVAKAPPNSAVEQRLEFGILGLCWARPPKTRLSPLQATLLPASHGLLSIQYSAINPPLLALQPLPVSVPELRGLTLGLRAAVTSVEPGRLGSTLFGTSWLLFFTIFISFLICLVI